MSKTDGARFGWEEFDSPTFGKAHLPIALAEIKSVQGDWDIFYPIVDSGAIISVFTESDCKRLGYELTEGALFTLTGIIGGSCQAYIHEVEMKLGQLSFKARVAFTQGKRHRAVLGRLDVFGNFQIALRQKLLETRFIRE